MLLLAELGGPRQRFIDDEVAARVLEQPPHFGLWGGAVVEMGDPYAHGTTQKQGDTWQVLALGSTF